jgi:hypothetical protein
MDLLDLLDRTYNLCQRTVRMHSHLTENKAFHQFHEFCIDVDAADEPWHLANKLDHLVGQAFHTADQYCSKTPRQPWSAKQSPLLEDDTNQTTHESITTDGPAGASDRNLA